MPDPLSPKVREAAFLDVTCPKCKVSARNVRHENTTGGPRYVVEDLCVGCQNHPHSSGVDASIIEALERYLKHRVDGFGHTNDELDRELRYLVSLIRSVPVAYDLTEPTP